MGSRGNAHWRVEGSQPHRVKGETPCPVSGVSPLNTGYYLRINEAGQQQSCFNFLDKTQKEMEEKPLRLTRHNGRSGKNGAYNPKHNDRRFDLENSEHIDAERAKRNIYWDCYRGITTSDNRNADAEQDFSFEKVEQMYYTAQYGDFIFFQNERNIKNRHPERNRTVEDLLKNKKTCPEETIYQIGTVEESVPPEILLQVANDFFGEMESRFGTHVHILNWALHLDEGTPHIQERHVFDCKNQYGELCPQQEKALEELGIPLPDSTKPKGRHNNRKQTFDAMCREILFEICERYGLQLDREPIYGGKAYLEKNDFIIEKQKQVMAEKEQALSEITMKLEDAKSLIEEIADTAYEKSCEVIAETVFAETQKQNLEVVANYQKWITEESNVPDDKKFAISKSLDALQNRMKKTADKLLNKVLTVLKLSTIKEKNMTVVKEKAKESLLAKLRRNKELVKKDGDSDKKIKQKNMER
ncbi:plasmid recombination protein [Anaeromassilibacillus sp. 1001302B_160321_C8]|uniref:plasmid recombination protein n=1 Tax=Anaeromassilibacillus sp. 1001302B_160321_C8 TaxID=2787132 RepID=UPI001FADFB50|nr:plasmid recombination protein [Anaeromassilibacillus sp. 1001302B_160321_C8]